MPNKYESLSKKEKDAIIARHKELVELMNPLLGEVDNGPGERLGEPVYAIKEDDLANKLDNEEYIASYRIAKEMKAIKENQNRILDEYKASHELVNPDDAKWMVHLLKTEDTPEARGFNNRLFSEYEKDPELVRATFFKKAMSFNPVKLIKLGDDKNKLIEFYKENHEIIDLANELSNSANASFLEGFNPEFKRAIEEMSEPLSAIGYPARLTKEALDIDHFAMPEVSEAQANLIVNNADNKNIEFSSVVRDRLEATLGNDYTVRPGAYFSEIKDKLRVKMNKDFLTNNVALESNDDEEREIADFSDVLNNRGDATHFTRKDNEKLRIKFPTKGLMDKYSARYKESLAQKQKIKGPFDAKKILDNHKGNFVERYLLRSTSKQWKAFEKAFEDYNNPESKDYLNKEELKKRSEIYLGHKFKNKDWDLSKLSGTSLKRAKLALDALNTMKEDNLIEADVDRELIKGYPTNDKSFLIAKDVEEIAPEKIKNGLRENDYVAEDEIEFVHMDV